MADSKARATSRALARILDQLRGEPSRTWSIIITLYGDAIVPRGGSVWLGTLLTLFTAMGIGEGVVRTAMSRLAADGWLERNRVGRNSFYRLADKGRATFAEATDHIYAARPRAWTGQFDLVLLNGADREAARAILEPAGFGSPETGMWISPGGGVVPIIEGALNLTATGPLETLCALAARSWRLEETARAYAKFVKTFEPLRTALEDEAQLDDLDALVARVLLIHEYRRIILRDPILPAEILPPDWPGEIARLLCADLYRQLLIPSERWLDRHAIDEDGNPLQPGSSVFDRFRE